MRCDRSAGTGAYFAISDDIRGKGGDFVSEKMCKVVVDGEKKEYPYGTTFETVVKEYQKNYKDDIILVFFNDKLRELHKRIKKDGELRLVTVADDIGRKAYRRSVIFLMQKAVNNLYGEEGIRVKVLHSIGQGNYCVLTGTSRLNADVLDKIKTEMKRLVDEDISLMKRTVSTEDAIKLFQELGMHDKERLFKYRISSTVNIYSLGHYQDYFYGYMAASTGYLKYFDLVLYQDGFVLLFPNKNTKVIDKFEPSNKLFHTLSESVKWGETMGISTIGALNDAIAKGHSQEIILTQEALMERRIGQLAQMIAENGDKKFVMIAGPSSSGKTTFSHRLSIQLQALGITPHPFPLDDYYLDHEKTPLDENGNPDYECLQALDVEQFNRDMNELLTGKEVELPVYNFKAGKREAKGKMMQLKKNDILVIEGIHGLNDELSYSIPKDKKFKIYISALTQLNIDEHNTLPTTDGRLIRRLVRDARTRGSSAKDTIAQWASVRRGEEKYIFPFQEQADVMFNSALIYELSVLKQYAEPLLFGIERDTPEYVEAKRLLKFLDYVLPIPSETIDSNSIIREFIGGSCFHV